MPSRFSSRIRRLSLVALLATALLAAGCGADDGGDDAATTATGAAGGAFPVTVEAANGAVTIDAEPQRIVSLSPTATEMLFAIGAGDQVEAVDDQSNHPPEAPTSELSGFTPNLEAVVGMNPDLVVASDAPDDLAAGLGKAGIALLVLPAAETIEDTYEQIEVLGDATGHADGAADVVGDMQSRIDAVLADLPAGAKGRTYFHELDDTLYTATSKTFIGSVYSMLGLVNVADPADSDGSGYPQLSAEFLVKADPDLIFLADTKCCGQTAATVAARPGWSGLSAVRNGAVVELDDDIASRWGPRIVDMLEQVADSLAVQPAGAGSGSATTMATTKPAK